MYLFHFSVNELQEEGKNAIESPTSPTLPDIGPEGYQLGMGWVMRVRDCFGLFYYLSVGVFLVSVGYSLLVCVMRTFVKTLKPPQPTAWRSVLRRPSW